jgi:hypothetical protein
MDVIPHLDRCAALFKTKLSTIPITSQLSEAEVVDNFIEFVKWYLHEHEFTARTPRITVQGGAVSHSTSGE